MDAEKAHDLVLAGLRGAGKSVLARRWLAASYAVTDPRLAVDAFGLGFPNPVGLAAGMDKDGVAVPALAALGFGSVEVGSVTALPQEGNPKPRLYRLLEDGALINRMGFNNRGADALSSRLARLRAASGLTTPGGARVILGVNVGKSRVVELADAPADYLRALAAVNPVADYLVINVSSPNTPGLRGLQEKEQLEAVLIAASEGASSAGDSPAKPVLLKLSPDLGAAAVADAVAVASALGVAGIIATNTTLSREGLNSPLASQAGGLSGRPLTGASLKMLERLRELTDLPLVSVGGIMTPADALDRILAGADLIQLFTGFVYEGPALVRETLRHLLASVEKKGVSSVSELR